MEDNTGKFLLLVLIVSIIIGALVLLIDKTYRIPYIIASNSSYYPGETDDMIKKYASKFVAPTIKKRTYKKFSKNYSKYKQYNKYKKKSYRYQSYNKKVQPLYKKFSGIININTAEAAQLQKLPGISSALAKKIILFRKIKHGFTAKEDLLKVPGLTQDIFNRIKDNISVELE